MDCCCDYDPAEFYHSAIRTARKLHRCEECGRFIRPGETYEHVTGKWNGDLDTFKTCSHCRDIRQFVKNSVPCFCWGHGNLDEDVANTIQDAYWRAPDEVKGLRFSVGRLVIARNGAKAEAGT